MVATEMRHLCRYAKVRMPQKGTVRKLKEEFLKMKNSTLITF